MVAGSPLPLSSLSLVLPLLFITSFSRGGKEGHRLLALFLSHRCFLPFSLLSLPPLNCFFFLVSSLAISFFPFIDISKFCLKTLSCSAVTFPFVPSPPLFFFTSRATLLLFNLEFHIILNFPPRDSTAEPFFFFVPEFFLSLFISIPLCSTLLSLFSQHVSFIHCVLMVPSRFLSLCFRYDFILSRPPP